MTTHYSVVLVTVLGLLLVSCSSAPPADSAAEASPVSPQVQTLPDTPSASDPSAVPAIPTAALPMTTAETTPVSTSPQPGPSMSAQGFPVDELQTYIERLADKDFFSGAVLVARDGTPIFVQAYGFANKAFNVPNKVDTTFNLGSKMFTAVAVAQLEAQGKLSFDDLIGEHLPDYPNADAAAKVTIHHLLTHTSGIGDYFDKPEYLKGAKERLRSPSHFLPLFAEDPLLFEPGTRFHYSNAGFIVLGLIIEKVTERSYFDYVREHIYRPAGMTGTDAYEMDEDVPNRATGYVGRLGSPQENPKTNLFLHVVKGGPAGGGFSTVEDLLRFDGALREATLLPRAQTDHLLAGKVEVGGGVHYAYGFFDRRVNGTRIVGHGGGFPGINGRLDMYLDLGYTVVVLANFDPPSADVVADRIQELLTGT